MTPMTIHEKVYATLAILVLLVAGSFGIYVSTHQESTTPAQAGGTGVAIECTDSTNFIATTSPGYGADCSNAASTTTDYLGSGANVATSTIATVFIGRATAADINIYAPQASSSSAVQEYAVQVSYNNIDWYPFATGSFTPAFVASTTNMHITGLNDNYLRLQARGITASSTIYAQIVTAQAVTQ